MLAVVLSFDQFPMRLLSCYGNSHPEMPCLNRIAAESVVFDQHFGEDFSKSPHGHAWWTGCYHFPRSGTDLLADVASLPMLLSHAGIKSQWLAQAASAAVPWPGKADLAEVNSFADLINRGCDVLHAWQNDGKPPQLIWLKASGLAWELKRYQELTKNDDALGPEMQGWQEFYRQLITEALERCAGTLSPLWERVRSLGDQQPVLFLLTAARGLSLGERADSLSEESTWAEEFVHLPLIVYHSDHPGGERRSAFTQSIDLPATLLDFFAWKSNGPCEGESFLPILRGEDIRGRESLTYGSSGSWEAMRTRDYHFVRLEDCKHPDQRRPLLFIKPDDPWDWHEVSAQEPELTEALSRQLDAFLTSARTQLPVASHAKKILPEEFRGTQSGS